MAACTTGSKYLANYFWASTIQWTERTLAAGSNELADGTLHIERVTAARVRVRDDNEPRVAIVNLVTLARHLRWRQQAHVRLSQQCR